MELKPGQRLLHYRIGSKIGEGEMGVVWRAIDTTLDREVAIKVLPEEFAADEDRLARSLQASPDPVRGSPDRLRADPTGEGFVLGERIDGTLPAPVTVVLNWPSLLD